MYIFIDESGVHKVTGKSSVALVYLSVENLDSLQKAVCETEREIRIKYFHWSHSAWNVRKRFIEAICRQDFNVKIALIRNPFFGSRGYEYALRHLVVEPNIRGIIIDGRKNKSYARKLKKVLRDKGISVRKLRTADDKAYPVLRIADACAGIVRYRMENPDSQKVNELYKMIEKKILITLEE